MMSNSLKWNGNLLMDDKNSIYASVSLNKNGKGYIVISYRNHSLIDFDGFKTEEEAKKYAERAAEKRC